MTERKVQYVLNSIAASGADITLTGGQIAIKATSATVPVYISVDYLSLKRPFAAKKLYRTEMLQISQITFTAAASTVYEFAISQRVDGRLVERRVYVDSTNAGIGNSAANINTNMTAQINVPGLKITPSGATTTLTLTAQTGYPTFQITPGQNTALTASATSMAGVAIASCTAATPSVITATAHGLSSGQVITITSADDTKLLSGTYWVKVLTANTYSLYSLDGTALAASATTTATVVHVIQANYGTATQLVAELLTDATAGPYTSYTLVETKVGGTASAMHSERVEHVFWLNSADTDIDAYITAMDNLLNGLSAAGTAVTNSELIATN